MFEYIKKTLLRWKAEGEQWWKGLSDKKKSVLALGGGVLLISIPIGGIFMTTAFVGAAISALTWMEIKDSPRIMRFVNRHGKAIDGILLVATLLFGLSGGVTSVLVVLFMSAYTTIGRILFCDDAVQESNAVEKENVDVPQAR